MDGVLPTNRLRECREGLGELVVCGGRESEQNPHSPSERICGLSSSLKGAEDCKNLAKSLLARFVSLSSDIRVELKSEHGGWKPLAHDDTTHLSLAPSDIFWEEVDESISLCFVAEGEVHVKPIGLAFKDCLKAVDDIFKGVVALTTIKGHSHGFGYVGYGSGHDSPSEFPLINVLILRCLEIPI